MTENIYKNLKPLENHKESIIIADFPKVLNVSSYKKEFEEQEKTIEAIKLIRTAKTESKIASNIKSEVYFSDIESLGANASEIEKLEAVKKQSKN